MHKKALNSIKIIFKKSFNILNYYKISPTTLFSACFLYLDLNLSGIADLVYNVKTQCYAILGFMKKKTLWMKKFISKYWLYNFSS